MTDGPDFLRKGQRFVPGGPVESLASEALKVLARQKGAGRLVMSEGRIERLRTAVLTGSEQDRSDALAQMRADGVTVETIIDLYIPEVARRLGEEWCRDQLGFAQVTIGSARLQGMVRDLVAEAPRGDAKKYIAGIAVVVLADEHHTLGAMVLTSQLRRLGVSVRLLLGAQFEDALRRVRADKFDAILFSVSHTETLVKLAEFIKNLRREAGRHTPIVVGGPVLELEQDVKSLTGADFVTSDVVEALRLCQLKISPRASVVTGRTT